MMWRKSIVAAGLSAGLVGGALAGAVIGVPGTSAAQEGGSTTTVAPEPAPDEDARPERPRLSEHLSEALAPLVEDGTLTREQADAAVDAIVAAVPAEGPGGGPRGGHPGRGPGIDAAAEALGMERDELLEQLRDGRTLAEVAEERGVSAQAVVDALVAEVREHLDEAVEDGRLTREQADERIAGATERITERVQEGHPGPGGRGHRGHGPGGGPGLRGGGAGEGEGGDPDPGD